MDNTKYQRNNSDKPIIEPANPVTARADELVETSHGHAMISYMRVKREMLLWVALASTISVAIMLIVVQIPTELSQVAQGLIATASGLTTGLYIVGRYTVRRERAKQAATTEIHQQHREFFADSGKRLHQLLSEGN